MSSVFSIPIFYPVIASTLPLDRFTETVKPSNPLPFLAALALLVLAIVVIAFKTKAGPIAKNTFVETIRQPIVLLLVAVSVVLTIFSGLMPMFTLSYQDVKMVKDMGFSTATLCGLLVAFFSASTSISNEIEKKTALTVLSKPVSRAEFIIGKYLGIMGTVLVSVVIIGVVLWGTVASKYWFEYYYAERGLEQQIDLQDETLTAKNRRILSMERAVANVGIRDAARDTAKGIFLSLVQVAALAAISVAVSTRLPMVVNIVLCMAVFVFGHISGALYSRVIAAGAGPIREGAVTVLCTILPNLENLNLSWRIAEGSPVSLNYMLLCLGYVAVYVVVALYIGAFSLSRRELS